MRLPTSVTNRRKFLERTALGAGSVLFLPGLLTSCDDHRIPDPNAPGTPGVTSPVVVGGPLNWNDTAKTAVVAGLRLVPEVGGLLSVLTSIFWPGGGTIWDQVKDQVDAAIDQKLTDAIYKLGTDQLNALHDMTTKYLSDVKIDTKTEISGLYDTLQINFAGAFNQFNTSGYEASLLPLFAQFANLHLSLIRDAVIAGKSWGRTDAQHAQDINDLQTNILKYINYAQTTYKNHYDYLANNVPADYITNEPWTSQNKFTREITLLALDYATTWPYYDVTKYPNGTNVPFLRELYSDPSGTTEFPDRRPITLWENPPRAKPTVLTAWGYTVGLNAVELTYPQDGGPNGQTTTGRMGRPDVTDPSSDNGSPGTSDQPYGLILNLSPDNPMVQARTSTDMPTNHGGYGNDIGVYAMEIMLKDGTIINKVGGDNTAIWGVWANIPDHFISSMYIHGVLLGNSDKLIGINNGTIADCIIFGFQYLTGGPTVSSSTLERLYVTNPRELSGADLAQASPTSGAADVLITDSLKAARQAYWAAIA